MLVFFFFVQRKNELLHLNFIGITNAARFDHQDSLIHDTSRVTTEEVLVPPQVLRGRIPSPRGEPLTHLGRVMTARTPRRLPYIHIVRRGVNARRAPSGWAQCHHSPIWLWLRIYESERSVCAPPWVIHGIHSLVPAPYTCSYASSAPSPSSFFLPPRIYFLLVLVLSPFRSFFLNVLSSFFRLHNATCEERALEVHFMCSYQLFCSEKVSSQCTECSVKHNTKRERERKKIGKKYSKL